MTVKEKLVSMCESRGMQHVEAVEAIDYASPILKSICAEYHMSCDAMVSALRFGDIVMIADTTFRILSRRQVV